MNTTAACIVRLLSRRDIARICNVHPGSVARWERQGLLTAVKINARVTRYRAEEVERLIANATCTTFSPLKMEAIR
jgi:predicted site-specific integrase-resolvase